MEAQKGGEKANALLHRALRETGKAGIAKVAIRNREYLAAVKPDGLFLILELMHFAQEVIDSSELRAPAAAELNPKEVSIAKGLIETLTSDWEPEKYADRYQDALKEVIDRKVQKLPATGKPAAPRTAGNVVDLLAVLQQSLAAGADKRKKAAGVSGARTPSTAALVKEKRRVSAGKN